MRSIFGHFDAFAHHLRHAPRTSNSAPRRCDLRLEELESRIALASFQALGSLRTGNASTARGLSADGSTVVGIDGFVPGGPWGNELAFRWTQTDGMQALGPTTELSVANAVSADGSTIVGDTGQDIGYGPRLGFRWTAGTGIVPFPPSTEPNHAAGVSADGSAVVGQAMLPSGTGRAYLWTQAAGFKDLGYLPGTSQSSINGAEGISADQSVVVGIANKGFSAVPMPFYWTAVMGMQPLGGPATSSSGGALAISADGSTAVGDRFISSDGSNHPYAWTIGGTPQQLSSSPGIAEAVSADGSTIVGGYSVFFTGHAFIWTATNGFRDLGTWLTQQYGATFLQGWTLTDAVGVSADGFAIAGNGIDSHGHYGAWIVHLSSAVATQLLVTAQPRASVGTRQSFQVQVSAEDATGHVVPSFTGSVTIQVASGPSNATLGGTRTVAAVSGRATFSGLTLDTAGTYTLQASAAGLTPATTNSFLVAYTVAQIHTAYGIDRLPLDGAGQTIAIVIPFNDPNILPDVEAFDTKFGLTSSAFLTVYNQTDTNITNFIGTSGQNGVPVVDVSGRWEDEEAMDVEWAHAIAPGAAIVVVECQSDSLDDRMQGVIEAGSLSIRRGVSVVSMSWGFDEGTELTQAQERAFDQAFVVPGVTFVASTGDFGSPGHNYSPNVVAVGGTSLQSLDAQGDYPGTGPNGEIGWFGSGGGSSSFEPQRAYQQGVVPPSMSAVPPSTAIPTGIARTIPDVSFDADLKTGVAEYDSYNAAIRGSPWTVGNGTSLGAPCWAGLIALVNQRRMATRGGKPLDGATQTLPAIYSLSSSDFRDIINGTSTGSPNYSATQGYDLVTGLGSPVADLLVPALAAWQPVSLAPESLAVGTAGLAYMQTITASGGAGGPYTFSVTSGALPAGFTLDALTGVLSGTSSAAATSSFVVTATDAFGATGTQNYSLTVSPAPADHFRLDAPATAVSGMPFDLMVTALDPYGNVDSNYTGTVTFASSDSDPGVILPADYTFTSGADGDNGRHTFSDVVLVTLGDQTVTAADTVTNSIIGDATTTIGPGNAPPPGGNASSRGKGHLFPGEVEILLAVGRLSTRAMSWEPSSPFVLRGGMKADLEPTAINHLFAVSPEARDASVAQSKWDIRYHQPSWTSESILDALGVTECRPLD